MYFVVEPEVMKFLLTQKIWALCYTHQCSPVLHDNFTTNCLKLIVEKNYGNIIHVLTCILQGVSFKLKSMER